MLPLTLLLVLPCLLLPPHTQGELCIKQVEELRLQMREEMKVEIEEMFHKREEAMMDELKTVLRAELKKEMETEEEVKKGKREAAEAAMKTQIENLQHELFEVKNKLENQEATMKQEITAVEKSLTTAVSQVRDVPYVMACAYRDHWDTDDATINYSSLISDYNNSDKPDGGDGKLDISTGQFTCLTAGYYTVTFSGYALVQSGKFVSIYLYHNGVASQASLWATHIDNIGGGYMREQASRTVIVHLAVGDTLELRADTCEGGIYHLTYCVSLTAHDY